MLLPEMGKNITGEKKKEPEGKKIQQPERDEVYFSKLPFFRYEGNIFLSR
jgi:hypothetical protein